MVIPLPQGEVRTENDATEIESNTIIGSIVCGGNTPAPTNEGESNKVSGASRGQFSGI